MSDEENSSSSSSDEEDPEILAQLGAVDEKLLLDPHSYDLLLNRIQILKKLGDLDKLRSTREKLAQFYPLSPELWLDWVQDEIPLADCSEERERVEELFERGVKDYVSPPLWLSYAQFTSVEKQRQIYERALASSGLHFTQASLIWSSYLEFEQDREKRALLLKRFLSIPLQGMEENYEKYKSELDEGGKENYSKALKKMEEIKEWEEKLLSTPPDQKPIVYAQYIEFEKSPARISSLFERSIAEFPLDPSLWLKFIQFGLKLNQGKEIAERASRNCPWDLGIWTKYMEVVEMSGQGVKEIFEKAILYATTGEEAGLLWLKYVESLRRKIDYEKVDEKVQLFFRTLDAAEEHLLQVLRDPHPILCTILLYRARISSHVSKSINKQNWSFVFKRGYGSQTSVWLEYFLLEKSYGDEKSLRKHFQRGLNTEARECVAQLWLDYERDFGSVEEMGICWKEVEGVVTKVVDGRIENSYAKKRKREDPQPTKAKKPKQDQMPERPESKVEKPKETADWKIEEKDSPRTSFLSNLAYSVNEEDLKQFIGSIGPIDQIRLVKDFNGRSKGYAYVVFEREEGVKELLKKDREPLKGRPVYVNPCRRDKESRPVKFNSGRVEKNKLFVKGLPLTTTQEQIQTLFSAFGQVSSVRLIQFRNGNSKGMAYVDFVDVPSATTAISQTDGKEYQGQILSVAISNPPKRAKEEDTTFARKTPNPFVPRALTVKKVEEPTSGLTNEEFRKFFVKK